MEKRKEILLKMGLTLIFMIVITGVLLLGGSALVYNLELSVKTAHLFITTIYVLVGLSGGLFLGKMMGQKRFLWGILAGLLYFACLLLVSLILNDGKIEDVVQILITFVLITASSMIGGMIS